MIVAGKLPLVDSGWELLGVECVADNCESKWKRSAGVGTVRKFINLASAVPVERFNASSAVGAYRHELPQAARYVRGIESIPAWDDFGAGFLTLFQQYEAVNIKGDIQAAQPPESITIDPEGKGPQNALILPLRFGAWSVEGQVLADIEDFATKLPKANVLVTKLTVTLSGETSSWKMEGSYAIKN